MTHSTFLWTCSSLKKNLISQGDVYLMEAILNTPIKQEAIRLLFTEVTEQKNKSIISNNDLFLLL